MKGQVMEVFNWESALLEMYSLLARTLEERLKASDPDAQAVMDQAYALTNREGKILPNVYVQPNDVGTLFHAATCGSMIYEDKKFIASLIHTTNRCHDESVLTDIFLTFSGDDKGPHNLTMRECLPSSYPPKRVFTELLGCMMRGGVFDDGYSPHHVGQFIDDLESQLGITIIGNVDEKSA